jgi:hypothetical protein
MAAVANNPAFAKKVGVPVSVGQEFSHADHLASLKKEARTPATTRKRGR